MYSAYVLGQNQLHHDIIKHLLTPSGIVWSLPSTYVSILFYQITLPQQVIPPPPISAPPVMCSTSKIVHLRKNLFNIINVHLGTKTSLWSNENESFITNNDRWQELESILFSVLRVELVVVWRDYHQFEEKFSWRLPELC